jgi:hypothetical protein
MGVATVDWARGEITVQEVGTADRRAPSPAVARVGALEEAEGRASTALLAEARDLPWAAGGTVGAAADKDPKAKAALEAAAHALLEVDTEYLPDGSARVTRALPIEAVREAIDGPVLIAPDWSGAAAAAAPAAIVIDARNLKVHPAVGIRVSDGTHTIAGATVYVAHPPGGATVATKVDHGALVVADLSAVDPGALVIVVVREGK